MNTRRTEQLAEFVLSAEPTPRARHAAVVPVADTIGVMLAGRRSEAGRLALEYARRMRPPTAEGCWVPGLSGGVDPETAALVNATLGHALDYDDSYPGAGHPSAPVLAAVLAAAGSDAAPLSGARLLDAFVVGFEVMARFADALGVGHYYHGWHVTCTSGSFGATAAAARVLGLGGAQTRTAFGIAGSLASGMQRNFGTSTKPLHSGLAARNGVLAATLALLGASADPAIIDGDRGFFDVYGQQRCEPENLDKLGAPYAIVDPGTAIKKYPCCFIATRPVDALLRLRTAHHLSSDGVAQVTCRVPARALHAMIYPEPADGLQAKFSMEYILAAALVDGRVDLDTFTDEAVRRPQVREVMSRVRAQEEARLRPEDPYATVSGPAKGGWVEVTVRTTDGREWTEAEREPHGGPRNPFTWPDLREKFLTCARFGGWQPAGAAALADRLVALPEIDDVSGVLGDFARSASGEV